MLMLYSIVHVSMETKKMTNFTFQSKFFISIFFTCQISACELQPFSCHDLANDIYSQTAKTVFSHLKTCWNGSEKKGRPDLLVNIILSPSQSARGMISKRFTLAIDY